MQKEDITHQLCPATMSSHHVTSTKSHQPCPPQGNLCCRPLVTREQRRLAGLTVILIKINILEIYMTVTQIYIIITKTLIRIRTPNLHCFKAGDARVNEQPGLASLHTLWLRFRIRSSLLSTNTFLMLITREYNRVALQMGSLNPQWSDDRIFLETRRFIGAVSFCFFAFS